MKKCKYCEVEKEIELFPKKGLKCKECVALYKREYALNNKEKIKEYKREYYIENKEILDIKYSEYREQNKEKIQDYKYRYNRSEKIKEYHAEYREQNKEKIKEKKKIYYEDNKDFVKSQVSKYINENREFVNLRKREIRYENIEKYRQREREYSKNRKETDNLYRLTCSIRGLIRISFKNQYTKKAKKTTEILGCNFETFKEYIESQFDENMNWDNYAIYWQLDHKTPVSWAKTENEVYSLNHYTNFQPLYWVDNYAKGNRWCG